MAFISKGVGQGEIQVNLKTIGLPVEAHRSVVATVRGMRDVVASSVVIDDGWLKCRVEVGQLQRKKLETSLAHLESSIVGICQHKVDLPGRGVEHRRAKPKDRFVNNPKAATTH